MIDQNSSSLIISEVTNKIVNEELLGDQGDMVPQIGSIEQYTDLVLKYAAIVLSEAERKGREYPNGKFGVLGLLNMVSESNGMPMWMIWRSWMGRHLIPIMHISANEQGIDLGVMERRLVDLLGYVFIGLQMVEEGKHS
ncbi:MAG TPA: hypothetical protein VNP04_13580 [Alphaproteobacteria bacterium]|nr:hypothetical protein [Alphaproteobacteria bacterium]